MPRQGPPCSLVGSRPAVTLSPVTGMTHTHRGLVAVAIFRHSYVFKCFLRSVLHSKAELTRFMVIDNTAITELRLVDGIWNLVKLNDAAHTNPLFASVL